MHASALILRFLGGVVQWLEQWNHKSAIVRKLFIFHICIAIKA